MEGSTDKHWAKAYLLDPLSEPQPSEETGPGTHFAREGEPTKPAHRASTHSASPTPSRKLSKKSTRPSTPPSGSPNSDRRSYPTPPRSSPKASHSRNSSLGSRFPGDQSHRPLSQIKAESRAAQYSPHLHKSAIVPPDTIDALSTITGTPYHHEGPFDAAMAARNTRTSAAPLVALKDSNAEALKATAPERVVDSVRGHRPLDGVAAYAPGEVDGSGHVYKYAPGEDMMLQGDPEGGKFKRWPGVRYDDGDLKGVGEPEFSRQQAEKSKHRESGEQGVELVTGIGKGSHGRESSTGLSTGMEGHGMWDDGEESKLHKLRKKLHRDH